MPTIACDLLQISSSPMMLRPSNTSLGRIDENCNGIVSSGGDNSGAAPKLTRHGSLILKGGKADNNGFLSASSNNQRHKLSLGEYATATAAAAAAFSFIVRGRRCTHLIRLVSGARSPWLFRTNQMGGFAMRLGGHSHSHSMAPEHRRS